jgi:hypothetical protein
MDFGIVSILVALITGVSSVTTAVIWGYVPKKRKEEIESLQRELLEVYMDAYNLKIIEESLENELGITKQEARKGFNISTRLEKKRIEKRISQLQSKI